MEMGMYGITHVCHLELELMTYRATTVTVLIEGPLLY